MAQEQIATYLGIERSMYANYEDGIVEPSIDVLETFANIVGSEPSALFEEDEASFISQLLFPIPKGDLAIEDVKEIASFKRLALSYLKMDRLS